MFFRKLNIFQKRACRKFIIKSLKINGTFRINGETLGSTKTNHLINAYIEQNKSNPIEDFLNNDKDLKSESGYVYVIGNRTMKICKIGFSINPCKRIKAIQTGCPYPVEIIALFEGDIKTERKLHKRYVKFKTNGEWFVYDGILKQNILTAIENRKQIKF